VQAASRGSGMRVADEGGAATWGGALGAGAMAGRNRAVVKGGGIERVVAGRRKERASKRMK
jgi:hypothetical protein